MQVSSQYICCGGHCRSASATDIQFHGWWLSRNCQPEHAPVTSCLECAAANDWLPKLSARLSLGNDASEMMQCQHNIETQTGNLASCCLLSRPVTSLMSSLLHTECHCVACCSCSPRDRRSGNCPAFTFPANTFLTHRALSVDSGLAMCRSCLLQFSPASDFSADQGYAVQDSAAEVDTTMHKSCSVPACCSAKMRYYGAGISFDSLNDDGCGTNNASIYSACSNLSPVSTSTKSASIGCQSPCLPEDIQMSPVARTSSIDYFNDQVSPREYRKRFEVCLVAADVSDVTTWQKILET